MSLSTRPTIAFLSSEEGVDRVAKVIGDSVRTSTMTKIRDDFQIVTYRVSSVPEDSWVDRSLRTLQAGPSPDVLLVDLDFDVAVYGGVSRGNNLAMELKSRLANSSVGVFSKYQPAPIERVVISQQGYRLLLVQIHDLVEGFIRMTGDEWFDVFSRAISQETETRTVERIHAPDSIYMRFEFPAALKIACCKYLLYFVQFMKSVGIETSFDLHENAGDVTFAVVPEQTKYALDEISGALIKYLDLPSSEIDLSSISPESEEFVVDLVREVKDLQYALSNANSTIRHQQQVIGNQQELGMIMIRCLKEIRPSVSDNPDTASIFGGLVEIKSFEYKGFSFKFGRLVNQIKRLKAE